jgi:Outer membrane protein beta-barrel domain
MMRFGRTGIVCAMVLFTTAGVARAQTTAAQSVPPHKIALEVTGGATLGHTSDASFGGEADYALNPTLDVIVEGAHIGNAATSDFSSRAQAIANAVGAGVSASQRVNFLDFGVRYRLPEITPTISRVHPYVTGGLGFAQVKNESTFSVNGNAVPPDSLGIQLGSDLSGSHTRPFLMLGVGGSVPFQKRYFVDFGYRYGHAFKATSESEVVLAGVTTQRLQVGVGITF